jgi:hypothetical protein
VGSVGINRDDHVVGDGWGDDDQGRTSHPLAV